MSMVVVKGRCAGLITVALLVPETAAAITSTLTCGAHQSCIRLRTNLPRLVRSSVRFMHAIASTGIAVTADRLYTEPTPQMQGMT